jgi:peptidoglycan/LPS O-acetylase OafA/YrhL
MSLSRSQKTGLFLFAVLIGWLLAGWLAPKLAMSTIELSSRLLFWVATIGLVGVLLRALWTRYQPQARYVGLLFGAQLVGVTSFASEQHRISVWLLVLLVGILALALILSALREQD